MKGTLGIKIRRESAKKMLEAQLLRGTKPEKIIGNTGRKMTTTKMVQLGEGDKTRIKREIEALNTNKK